MRQPPEHQRPCARKAARRLVLLAAAALAASCSSGKATAPVQSSPPEKAAAPAVAAPSVVTPANIDEAVRRLLDLDQGSDAFRELRGKVVEAALADFDAAVKKGGTAGAASAFELFARMLKLHSPEDILAGHLSPGMEKMAAWAVDTFSPLGDEAKVMTGLIVVTGAHPEDDEAKAKLETLLAWVETARENLQDDLERISQVVDIFDRVAAQAPVPVVTTRLVGLYDRRHQVFGKLLGEYAFGGASLADAYMKYYVINAMLDRTSYDLLRLSVRMGRPTDALARIEKYKGKRGYDPKIVALLEGMAARPADAAPYLELSALFLDEDADQALWACYAGWKKSPTDYRFPVCLADLYAARKDRKGAEEYLTIALGLSDKESQVYTKLLELYKGWLDEALGEEKNEEAAGLLAKLEKTYTAFQVRWPQVTPPVGWSDIIKRKGLIEYYSGEADKAATDLEQAGFEFRDMESLITLGTIHVFQRQTDKAVAVFKKALGITLESQMETRYFKMLLHMKLGDAYRLAGNQKEAQKSYGEALERAKALIPYISLDFVGKMHVVEGQLELRLGKRDEALESFKTAAAMAKDAGTYADILSFLVGAGDMAVTREIYHLAYTDATIEPKWRVYFSLWFLALARFTGEAGDEATAMHVLSSTQPGDPWLATLASCYAGSLSWEEAEKAAKTAGEKAELWFFEAFDSFRGGDKKKGVELLKKSLGTGYFAYYEVAMALELLRSMGELQ